MVYVHYSLAQLNRYSRYELTEEKVAEILSELGMELKGIIEEDGEQKLRIELTAEKIELISPTGVVRALNTYEQPFEEEKRMIHQGKDSICVAPSIQGIRDHIAALKVSGGIVTEEMLQELIYLQEKIHDSFGRGRRKAAIGIYPLNGVSFPLQYYAEKPEDIHFVPLGKTEKMSGKEILEEHETGKKYAHLLKECTHYPVLTAANGNVLSMPPIINSATSGEVKAGDQALLVECTGNNERVLHQILTVFSEYFLSNKWDVETIVTAYEAKNSSLSTNEHHYVVTSERVNKLLGTSLSIQQMCDALQKMGYSITEKKEEIHVTIPYYKHDVWSDVDIIDDVARGVGYGSITPITPIGEACGKMLPTTYIGEALRDHMVSLGCLELYTFMLTMAERQIGVISDAQEHLVRIHDAAEEGINSIRYSMFPEILEALRINKKSGYPQKLFEVGCCFYKDGDKMHEMQKLACLYAGYQTNITDIQQALMSVMKLFGIEVSIEKAEASYAISGRLAEIHTEKGILGHFGELHPHVIKQFHLQVPIQFFEINVDKLCELIGYEHKEIDF